MTSWLNYSVYQQHENASPMASRQNVIYHKTFTADISSADNNALIAWFHDPARAYDCDSHLVSWTGDNDDDIDDIMIIDEHRSDKTICQYAMSYSLGWGIYDHRSVV